MKKRKVFEGVVTSNKMQKTLVVTVTRTRRHQRYGKVVELKKKFYAHTDSLEHQIGDKVKIIETRPLSKLKRWRVAN